MRVKPGEKVRNLLYHVSGMGESGSTTGFHEIGLQIAPPVLMNSKFEDVTNSPQQKAQIFSVPQNHGGHLTFSFIVNTLGSVRFSHFSLEEVPVDPTEKWSLKLQNHFSQHSFSRRFIFPPRKG